jgi:uncharacterized protein
MMATNIDILRKGYEDFNRGDLESLSMALDEHIEWTEPEWTYGPPGGTLHSRDDVVNKVFAGIPEGFDSFQLEPRAFYGDGDAVVAEGSFKVSPKGSGRTLDVPFAHVWRFRDGKAVSMRNYIDVKQLYELQAQRKAA